MNMAIPEFSLISIKLLKFLKDKKTHDIAESVDFLANFFKLSVEDRTKLKPSSDRQTIFYNRVLWAKYYLKQAGLLENQNKSKIRITELGLNLLKKDLKKMDRSFLTKLSIESKPLQD